jgi:hypothetical protein
MLLLDHVLVAASHKRHYHLAYTTYKRVVTLGKKTIFKLKLGKKKKEIVKLHVCGTTSGSLVYL